MMIERGCDGGGLERLIRLIRLIHQERSDAKFQVPTSNFQVMIACPVKRDQGSNAQRVTRDEIGWVRQWTMRAIKFPAFATECQLLTVDCRLKSQERSDAKFQVPTSNF
jgi:hypothetical protein